MKKIIVLLLFLLALSSCNEANVIIGLDRGDKRITITDKYIYIEKCTGLGGLNNAFWEYERIVSRDSIKEENILDYLEP